MPAHATHSPATDAKPPLDTRAKTRAENEQRVAGQGFARTLAYSSWTWEMLPVAALSKMDSDSRWSLARQAIKRPDLTRPSDLANWDTRSVCSSSSDTVRYMPSPTWALGK